VELLCTLIHRGGFSQRFSFDRAHRSTYNGLTTTGGLPFILINVPGRAFCEESNNLVRRRNETKARHFVSAYLSPCEHGKMHENTEHCSSTKLI